MYGPRLFTTISVQLLASTSGVLLCNETLTLTDISLVSSVVTNSTTKHVRVDVPVSINEAQFPYFPLTPRVNGVYPNGSVTLTPIAVDHSACSVLTWPVPDRGFNDSIEIHCRSLYLF
jgi:hypothetical protein